MAASPTNPPQSTSLEPATIPAHHRTRSAIEEEKELAFGQVWTEASDIDRPERPTIDGSRRKSSVAFHTVGAEETIRKESPKGEGIQAQAGRRMSSPPPPPTYNRGVAFDTFDNKDVPLETYTLQYRHADFRYTSRSRTFLCGTDNKDYSEYALEWLIDELVDDGDDIICLRVLEKDSKHASEAGFDRSKYRDEAQTLLDNVVRKNASEGKAIGITLELAVGRIQEVIQRMILMYEPAALIVGTRGRSLNGVQGLLPGSVSKFCLQHSPVPVVVVRPSNKRIKKKQKRLQESGRSLYSNMLAQSKERGRLSIVYDKSIADDVPTVATKKEAEAVAKAIGPRRGILRNHHHGGGFINENPESTSDEPAMPSFSLPIGFLTTEPGVRADMAMKSPIIAMLGEAWDDSPEGSGPPSRARSRSPNPRPFVSTPRIIKDSAPVSSGIVDRTAATAAADNPVFSDDAVDGADDDLLGVHKVLDHRRPSTRESTPWLNSILRQPEKRPPSRNRSGRSRSR